MSDTSTPITEEMLEDAFAWLKAQPDFNALTIAIAFDTLIETLNEYHRIAAEVAAKPKCYHCGETIEDAPNNLGHWETCLEHPARARLEAVEAERNTWKNTCDAKTANIAALFQKVAALQAVRDSLLESCEAVADFSELTPDSKWPEVMRMLHAAIEKATGQKAGVTP